MVSTELLQYADQHYPLTVEDRLKLQMLGHKAEVVTAGIVHWGLINKTTKGRTTFQIRLPSLFTFSDRSEQYEILMKDLDRLEASAPDIESCMYLYTRSDDNVDFYALTQPFTPYHPC